MEQTVTSPNFTLVIEPIRDPRLDRNQEAFSEDPLLR